MVHFVSSSSITSIIISPDYSSPVIQIFLLWRIQAVCNSFSHRSASYWKLQDFNSIGEGFRLHHLMNLSIPWWSFVDQRSEGGRSGCLPHPMTLSPCNSTAWEMSKSLEIALRKKQLSPYPKDIISICNFSLPSVRLQKTVSWARMCCLSRATSF